MQKVNTLSTLSLQSSGKETSEQIDAFLELSDFLVKDGHQNAAYRLLKILQQSHGTKQWLEDRLQSLYRNWIPRWHFEMLNDNHRCQAYADAIATLDLKDKIVFDLGAGVDSCPCWQRAEGRGMYMRAS